MTELEITNKLYLELSQFATAITAREMEARRQIALAMQELDCADENSRVRNAKEFLTAALYYLQGAAP